MTKKLAILISGSGTTMEAIINACKANEVGLDIACVISSKAGVGGITKAKHLGLAQKDILIIDPKDFKDKDKKLDQERFGNKIIQELEKRKVDVVTQNGWLPLTPENVIKKYRGNIFNQHPGPVPEFGGQGMYGRRVHAAVLIYRRLTGRDFWTEAVAQRVDNNFDQGKVVKSKKITIQKDDTVEDLQARVLPIEHLVQIELLKDVAKGKIKEETHRRVSVKHKEEEILALAKKIAGILYPHG